MAKVSTRSIADELVTRDQTASKVELRGKLNLPAGCSAIDQFAKA
jgi:hypothetical protein